MRRIRLLSGLRASTEDVSDEGAHRFRIIDQRGALGIVMLDASRLLEGSTIMTAFGAGVTVLPQTPSQIKLTYSAPTRDAAVTITASDGRRFVIRLDIVAADEAEWPAMDYSL
jgi:hypothetical protein